MQQLYRPRDFANMRRTSDPEALVSGSRDRRAGAPWVLVVDDDSGVRAVFARALEGAGFAVLAADDGMQALEFLEGEGTGIDLVLTDICMPRLGGLELGREIAARQFPIPVLYMSADPPEPLRGGSGPVSVRCLPKPFSIALLVTTVAQLLAGSL